MPTNIQIVKLTTGEDLIGELEELETEGRNFLLIKKPALIMIMPQPGSETDFTVGLAPYAPFAKEHQVPIFPAHVVSIYDPGPEMLKTYNEKFAEKSAILQPDFVNKKILNESIIKGK